MIQFCACIKRFVSSSEIPEDQDSSNSCRSCGKILLINELGVLSRRMWSTAGPELSRVIDPQLKWKISSNGKQRALRKARTFSREDGKSSATKYLKDIEDLFDKASKREGDTLISESEKLGVSLLGRRFSDNLETFPIKKRIISLLPSHSTPHILSSSGFHDHNQASHFTLFQNNQLSPKHDDPGINPSRELELDHEKGSVDDHTCDSADFSGISILAAAACHSSVERGLNDAEGSTVEGNSFENPNSSNPELGNVKPTQVVPHFTTVNTLVEEPPPKDSDECKVDQCGLLDSFVSKMKPVSCCDDRLKWDLNTVMDVWESQSDDYSKCGPSSNAKSSWNHDMVIGNKGLLQSESGFGINGVGLVASENQYTPYSLCMLEKDMDRKRVSIERDCDEEKRCSTQSQVCESLREKCQFKDAKIMQAIIPEITIPDINCENSFSVEGVADYAGEAKCENPVIVGDICRNMHVLDAFAKDKKVNGMLHDEGRSISTVDSYDYSGECSPDYGGKGNNHVEKHRCISADVAINLTKSPSKQLDQKICREDIGGDDEKAFLSSSKSMSAEGCLSDDADEFGNTNVNDNQSAVILFNSQDTSNELLPSRNACISSYEDMSANTKVDDSKSSVLSCEKLNASKSAFSFCQGLVNSISAKINLDTKGISPFLISHGEGLTSTGVRVNSLEKDSVEKHFCYEHHTAELEKVDFLGDEDSQYEDGELRDSALNSWGEDGDGVEEVETERVDYGSDCREADSFEAESDFCSQSDLAVGTIEYKPDERLVSTCDGNRLWFTEDSQSKCLQTPSGKDFSVVSYSEGDVGGNMSKDSGKVLDVNMGSEVPARDESSFLASNLPNDTADDSGKASQSSSSRLKHSGWDKLPRSKDASISLRNNDNASIASSINNISARKIVPSFEGDEPCEATCTNSFFDRENRKHDHIVLNAERSADATRLDGRSRAFHSRSRDRIWVDENCRIDISGYYSSPKFPRPGSRNAAAAAVAKVESNGFVVAPDGTIVKGCSLGPGSHSVHSSKSSSHFQSARRGSPSDGEFCMSSELINSREISPGRCIVAGRGRASRYGSRLFNLGGHGSKYHGPIIDSRVGSQPVQHPSSRRQRSFSPHGRPILLSHELTRSPSRSRTRSPHAWTSPRERNDGRISGIPVLKRQSRSPPNFKPRRRIPRQPTPQHHSVPAEEFVDFAPLSRNHSSPPHQSRWFDNDLIFHDNLREHQSRSRGRSSRARIFSQSSRLDDMDSHGRTRSDVYYEPIYSGRFQEYAGYGWKTKPDGCGPGRRGKNNRFGMFHPEGHLKGNANMMRPKSLVFQRRQSPRTFDRSIDAQTEDSHHGIKREKVHFTDGRDAKLNSGFKPIKVPNTSDNMPLQRRPS